MACNGRAAQGCIGRHHHLVACLPEPDNQSGFGAVVVEVEIRASTGAAGA
jgi:hypothetical protein